MSENGKGKNYQNMLPVDMQTGKNDPATTREYIESDLDAVVGIANRSLTEYYGVDLIQDLALQWPDGFLVYDFLNVPVGFIVGTKYSPTEGRILLLAVKQDFRRRGIGALLLRDFMEVCRRNGIMSIRLEVRTDNHGAIRFYKTHSFSIISTLKRYYTDSSDAYVMWRML